MAKTILGLAEEFEKGKGSFAIINGEMKHHPTLPTQIEATVVYDVVRVHEGRLLFAKDHCARLRKTLQTFGVPIDPVKIESSVRDLVHKGNVSNQNIKILYTIEDGKADNCYIYPLLSYYPPMESYTNGVRGKVIHHVRENPNSKILNMNLKDLMTQASEEGIYELLLLNEDDCVTEGSRSNVFCIKDGTIYTAPSESVLKGITRTRVLALIEALGLPVVFTPLSKRLLSSAEALFITSTSNGILPLCSLIMLDEEKTYEVAGHVLLQRLITAFFSGEESG
eukprot:TRINITY_DN6184_c0_g1_i1.p1 TRINITY_DN6184_c0_g1~~TRINITY_DN6184_c0_g1_i1.p1  ORF type:complete len:328 (+),score=43.54 TRINITY_DN6184_c0_g1_i1:144-986(+)